MSALTSLPYWNATRRRQKKEGGDCQNPKDASWILGSCLLGLVVALGTLYVQSGGWVPRVNSRLSPTEKQLMGIATLYRGYGATFGKPPPDMRALKAWAEKLDKQKLAHFEIDNIETLFVSERDGQPFILVRLPRGLGPVLAHETTGAHGKRW